MNEVINKKFTHLKIHTQYSICEGALRISDLAKYCKTNQIRAVGLCDSHNLCGTLEFSESIAKSKKKRSKPGYKVDKVRAKKMVKSRAKSGISGEFVPVPEFEESQFSAYDKVKAIRNRLGEGIDAHAARELKLYIENDRDLYRQQIVPIIKNVQRKMKADKYDHAKAPKLWLYLVDNGAKKYEKEYGTSGSAKTMFPKDLRLSIANEFATEYKAEIDIQGGDML